MQRLPIHEPALAAAAHVALGATIEPKAYKDAQSGDESVTWFATQQVPAVAKEMEKQRRGTLPPSSPFAAALRGVEALRSLREWLRRGGPPPDALTKLARPEGPLALGAGASAIVLRRAEDLRRAEIECVKASLAVGTAFPVLPHHLAAAAIAVGCIPMALTQGDDGRPQIILAARTVQAPEATLSEIHAALRQDVATPETLAIGGCPAGEHPVFYAFEAVRVFALYEHIAEVVGRNPIIKFKAKSGPRTALASASLLQEGRRHNFREHLRRHLAGAAV